MRSLPVDSKDKVALIYNRHFDMVYRVCFAYLKNQADTEDAVSDVFVKLLKTNTAFENDRHEKAWLTRTAVNLCKDRLKSWWHKREPIDGEVAAENSGFEIDETLQVVLRLPLRYKDVIVLHYYEGYKTDEIAEILRRPHSTIRNHLSEARKLLKGVLENE